MKIKQQIILTISMMVMLAGAPSVSADGKFVPPEFAAEEPGIPRQQAILKYKDGVETLVVQSTVSGKGDHFGWIIPIPSRATRVEPISPGLLKTMSLQMQPVIRTTDRDALMFPRVLLIAVGVACLAGLFVPKIGPWGFGIALFVSLTVTTFMVPNFVEYRSGGSSGPAGIQILQTEMVGDYYTDVVAARSAKDLDKWLSEKHFRNLSDEETGVVNEYIEENWVFFVASLTRNDISGEATPHPILLEFAADEPIYPMRLTATGSPLLHLELFVVADQEAVPANYNLKKMYCNSFSYQSARLRPCGGNYDQERAYRFMGDIRFHENHWRPVVGRRLSKRQEIAHPEADKILWNDCVVTRLVGNLRPRHMAEDMTFQLTAPKPFIAAVWSRRGASVQSRAAALYTISLGLIAAMFLFTARIQPETTVRRKTLFWVKAGVRIAMTAILIFSLSYIAAGDKVTTHSSKTFRRYFYNFQAGMAEFFSEPSFAELSKREINEVFREAKDRFFNPFTGDAVVVEHSPGNVWITWEEERISEVYFIDRDGAAVTFEGEYASLDGRGFITERFHIDFHIDAYESKAKDRSDELPVTKESLDLIL